MHGTFWLGCMVWLLALPALAGDGRFLQSLQLPNGRVLVVAEPALEPRSIGSYSLRLYGGRNPDFPHDDYLAGLVRPRDGVLESVHLLESPLRVLVVSRSVGSGSYRSSDLFAIANRQLHWLKSVSGVLPEANIFYELDSE